LLARAYYAKSELRLGVVQKVGKNSNRVIFSFYRIADDTVEDYENADEIADYESQVQALFALRISTQLLGLSELPPTLEDLRLVAKGLCTKKIPARNEIRRLSKEFPKNHPWWFNLLLVIVSGAVVEVIGVLLHFQTH